MKIEKGEVFGPPTFQPLESLIKTRMMIIMNDDYEQEPCKEGSDKNHNDDSINNVNHNQT